jgi:hypothetical protein
MMKPSPSKKPPNFRKFNPNRYAFGSTERKELFWQINFP